MVSNEAVKHASQMQIAGLEGRIDDLIELVRGLAALYTASGPAI